MKDGQAEEAPTLTSLFTERHHIGKTIRSRRRAKGWSQSDLAKAAGASRNWISAIESGRPASKNMLVDIFTALGIANPAAAVNTLDEIDSIETRRAMADARSIESPQTVREKLIREIAIDHEEVQRLLSEVREQSPDVIDRDTLFDTMTVLTNLTYAARYVRAADEPEGVALNIVEATRKTARIIKKMLEYAKAAGAAAAERKQKPAAERPKPRPNEQNTRRQEKKR